MKGTEAGIRHVLDSIGAVYDYVERPSGDPFTAAVTVRNSGALRISDASSVRQLVDAYKRQSVVMDITIESGLMGEIPIGGGIGAVVVAHFELDASP